MPCSRCNAQIVEKHFYDLVDDEGVLRLGAWRCASCCARCGAVVADEIVESAALPPTQARFLDHPTEGSSTFMMF